MTPPEGDDRLLDDPGASPALRRALELRGVERLPDGRRAALRASIAAAVSTPPPAPLHSPHPWAGLALGAAALIVVIVLGLALLLWSQASAPPVPDPLADTAERAQTQADQPRPETSAAETSAAETSAAETSAAETSAAETSAAESIQDTSDQAAVSAATADTAEASPSRSDARPIQPEDEITLIINARQALRGHRSRRALALLRRHERRFPHGLLEQEREALAIEALLRSGRTRSARRRAERFFSRYPNSPLGARVRELLSEQENEPSSPPE